MPCFKKPRSKLGKFIDAHDLKQIEVAKVSGVKEATLSRVCNISSVSPTAKNASKILRALRKLTGKMLITLIFGLREVTQLFIRHPVVGMFAYIRHIS